MIHPHTYIHPNARLATNVKIDPFTVIHQDVVIGEGTWIGSNVTIMEGARIGKNCRIFPGAVISAIPQDLKFEDERTTVEIGDNTTIREFVTINRGTKDMEKTMIGKNCLIAAQVGIAGVVTLKDGVTLWGQVGVSKTLTIGENAVIYGQSGVGTDTEGGKAYLGSPILEAKEKSRELVWVKRIPELWEKVMGKK